MESNNIVAPDESFGPMRRALVKRMFERGEGHPGLLQDWVSKLSEAEAAYRLNRMSVHLKKCV